MVLFIGFLGLCMDLSTLSQYSISLHCHSTGLYLMNYTLYNNHAIYELWQVNKFTYIMIFNNPILTVCVNMS